MKSLQDYTIIIRPDDNGTFVAYVPAIPGCQAWGQTTDEAGAEIRNVFEMIQEEYAEKGLLMPEDVELVVANARRKIRATEKTPINQEELDKFDPVKQHEALSKLIQEWEEEGDEQEQTETWEFLRKALDEDRLSNRPLFP